MSPKEWNKVQTWVNNFTQILLVSNLFAESPVGVLVHWNASKTPIVRLARVDTSLLCCIFCTWHFYPPCFARTTGQGGSVINTVAFSCNKFSVITSSFLTRWLRNFAKNNRYHSAIVRNIPISLIVNISWEISAKKDPIVQRKSRLVKTLLVFFTEISGIGFYWYNNMPEKFQKNR